MVAWMGYNHVKRAYSSQGETNGLLVYALKLVALPGLLHFPTCFGCVCSSSGVLRPSSCYGIYFLSSYFLSYFILFPSLCSFVSFRIRKVQQFPMRVVHAQPSPRYVSPYVLFLSLSLCLSSFIKPLWYIASSVRSSPLFPSVLCSPTKTEVCCLFT